MNLNSSTKNMNENELNIDDKFSPLISKLDKWIEDFKRIPKRNWEIRTSKLGVWIYKELQPFGDRNMEGITVGITDEYGQPEVWFSVWGIRCEILNALLGKIGISSTANKIHANYLSTLHTFKMTFPKAKYFWQDEMEEPLSVGVLKLMLRHDKQEFVNYELNTK